MKKLFTLMLTLCMVFTLTACGMQSNESTLDGQGTSAPVQSDNSNGSKENDQTDVSPSDTDAPNTYGSGEDENKVPDETTGSKVLVAYFSCTGNTQGLAEKIAESLGADLYEIMPEEPYTGADLNYNTDCRANREQNDDSARPAISGVVEHMDDYDIIFLGYPIWWAQAPKIIYTFVESYDLSGKTIVPFCTSGSSGVGSSAINLHSSAPEANWIDGTRFSASASQSDLEEWLSSLGLDISAK